MISYRRGDSGPITGRIYDRLQARFGRDYVFMDLDSIPIGVDFRSYISDSLARCHILLVVIGPHWLATDSAGQRRIDAPNDFVRLEVAQALCKDTRIVPLLIDNTAMPSAETLPEDLRGLAFRNALRVDSGVDFHHHIDRLCAAIEAAERGEVKVAAPDNRQQIPPTPNGMIKRLKQLSWRIPTLLVFAAFLYATAGYLKTGTVADFFGYGSFVVLAVIVCDLIATLVMRMIRH